MSPVIAASGRLDETGMLFFCEAEIVGVLSLRVRSSLSPETVLSSEVSIADDIARAWERGDRGWLESELALGFGGGGMARLEIASASAGVDSGASESEGGWVEPLEGKGSELLLMVISLSLEDAMSGNIESRIRYSELEICERGRQVDT
jgi:hypothetical protein